MAETIIRRVEDELTTCAICLESYKDPKLLQCFHVYCQSCLERLVFHTEQNQSLLVCPSCRQVTPVPASGVAGLQLAFHINRLQGIMEDHRRGVDAGRNKSNKCSEHIDEECKLYCEACWQLICYKCAIRGGKHHEHNHEPIESAFARYKEEISLSLEPVERQMSTVKEALERLERSHDKITDQKASIEADINNSIRQLQEILDARKTQLLDQLNQITERKLESLVSQKDKLITTKAQLGSCLEYMKQSLKSDSHNDVLNIKQRVVTQINELITPLPPDTLDPCAEANLLYIKSMEIASHCQNFGQLSGESVQEDPSKCYAESLGGTLESAIVEEVSTLIVHAVNYQGEPCTLPVSSLDCELNSEMVDTRVLGRVERIEQSKYKVTYRPTIKGRHSLHIKVKGKHIRWSPFSVAVKSTIEKLGTPFLSITGVSGPCGVTFNHKQELVVSGFRDHYIAVFSPDAKRILSFGTRGSDQGQFQYPMGVAVDKDGHILVVDSANNRIQKFSAKGQFLEAVGTKGTNRLKFDRPCGIAFNTANNKVYIADTSNNRVQVLNSNLTFSSTFGRLGHSRGQFAGPHGIACSLAGYVYVADKYNHRVQVFTASGRSLKSFGKNGAKEGELTCPIGVAVDQEGMVYVSEDVNNRISIFTPEGKFVKVFGREGSEPGQFQNPRELAVDASGVVCVCDCNNDRIQIF